MSAHSMLRLTIPSPVRTGSRTVLSRLDTVEALLGIGPRVSLLGLDDDD
jgi:hypothetical protein